MSTGRTTDDRDTDSARHRVLLSRLGEALTRPRTHRGEARHHRAARPLTAGSEDVQRGAHERGAREGSGSALQGAVTWVG